VPCCEQLRAYNTQKLHGVERGLRENPADGRLHGRRVRLLLNQAYLIASQAHEHRHPSSMECCRSHVAYRACQRRYLAQDPEGILSRTIDAVGRALRTSPPPEERATLLSIRATALCFLARHLEEADSLREAATLSRHHRRFAVRLAEAYAASGRFKLAEAALSRAQ
jgi:hypothetical protein